jgi:hypothetical protein
MRGNRWARRAAGMGLSNVATVTGRRNTGGGNGASHVRAQTETSTPKMNHTYECAHSRGMMGFVKREAR